MHVKHTLNLKNTLPFKKNSGDLKLPEYTHSNSHDETSYFLEIASNYLVIPVKKNAHQHSVLKSPITSTSLVPVCM